MEISEKNVTLYISKDDIELEIAKKKSTFQMRILRYGFVFRGNSGPRVRLPFSRESA